MKTFIAMALWMCAATLPAGAQDATARRDAVLVQMDKASEQFKSARADFVWDYYQAVVKDTTTQTGPIYFEHTAKGVQMGAVVLDAHGAKNKIIEYKDGLLRYYEVPSNQVRLLKAGANQAQYESFLTLGFGGSGRELLKAWNVTYLGTETLMDNGLPVQVEKLDLVSKDAEVLKMFTHVTIWVDAARGVSLKQVFDTPSHDRRTATYSHIKVGGKLDAGTFKISDKAVKVN